MIRIPEYLERRRAAGLAEAAPVAGARARGPLSAPSTVARPLTVLFAPDSFKGSLTSVEVARALADGWAPARPGRHAAPLAARRRRRGNARRDRGGRRLGVADRPPRRIRSGGRSRPAGCGRATASAGSSSWRRPPGSHGSRPDERDPLGATTRGTGEVLRAAIDAGVRPAHARDRRQRDDRRRGRDPRGARGAASTTAAGPDLSGLDPRLGDVALRIACDVTNPLLGERGAAATYGPQKGASPDDVARLDARLGRFADALEAATGRRERDTPGAGAAGGTGFALLSLADRFGSVDLVPGVDLVMAETDLAGKLATRRPRRHRRRPDRRADGLRQDGAGRRPASRRGGRRLHRRRWRRHAGGHRGARAPRRRRRARSRSGRRPSRRRWPRRLPRRTLRRADRSAHRPSGRGST